MRFRPLLFLALLATIPAAACDNFGYTRLDVRTYSLQHRSGFEAADLIDPYVFGDRTENPGAMSATPSAVTVRETPDNLDKIARVLEEFDQPIPDVRLYFQLIEADSFQDSDPAIAEVVDELKSLFRFQGYRLLGEATVPLGGGSTAPQAFSQRFLGVENPIRVEATVRTLPSGKIRLDPVQLSDPWNDLMSTSVSIAPGQTIVLGGAQADTQLDRGSPSGERVLILTVRAGMP